MDGFLIALAAAVIAGALTAIWLARVIYAIVGRALDNVFRLFDRDDPA